MSSFYFEETKEDCELVQDYGNECKDEAELDIEYESDGEEGFEDYEEEEEDMDEEELIRMLDRLEPPLETAGRLFHDDSSESSLNILSEGISETLKNKGYVVIDNFVAASLVEDVHSELLKDVADGKFLPAHRENPDDPHRDLKARSDYTKFVSPVDEKEQGSAIGEVLESLLKLREDLAKIVRLTDDFTEYQLAYYPEGVEARYHRHRDALPDDGLDDRPPVRKITSIVYLNPGSKWENKYGGHLRVFLPGQAHAILGTDAELFEDIAPQGGRLVIFLSGVIDHAVLPVLSHHRIALTAWHH